VATGAHGSVVATESDLQRTSPVDGVDQLLDEVGVRCRSGPICRAAEPVNNSMLRGPKGPLRALLTCAKHDQVTRSDGPLRSGCQTGDP
jgi:hypothetical protein